MNSMRAHTHTLGRTHAHTLAHTRTQIHKTTHMRADAAVYTHTHRMWYNNLYYLRHVANNKGSDGQKAPIADEYIGVHSRDDQKDGHGQQVGAGPGGQKYSVWIHTEHVDYLKQEYTLWGTYVLN